MSGLPRTRTGLLPLLESRGLAPRKRDGQNFLVDAALADAVVADAGVAPGDVVVEVGPGAGALTQPLLAAGARVVAVEIDRGLAELLTDCLATDVDAGRLRVVHGDVLGPGHTLHGALVETLAGAEDRSRTHLVSNLPYSVGTLVIARTLRLAAPPSRITAMLQREVVDRLRASPGERAYGPLAVMTALHGGASLLRTVPRDVFVPRPDVASAVFAIEPRADAAGRAARAADLARVAFGGRRKRIARTLAGRLGAGAIRAAGVDPGARPGDVSPDRWAALADAAASAEET